MLLVPGGCVWVCAFSARIYNPIEVQQPGPHIPKRISFSNNHRFRCPDWLLRADINPYAFNIVIIDPSPLFPLFPPRILDLGVHSMHLERLKLGETSVLVFRAYASPQQYLSLSHTYGIRTAITEAMSGT